MTVGTVGAIVSRYTYLANPLRRFVSSGSSLTVDVVMFCLSLSNWGMRSSIFSLTSSKCCESLCQLFETNGHSTDTS